MTQESEEPIRDFSGSIEADALGHSALLQEQLDARNNLPFWRRPAPWWQVVFFPLSLLAITLSTPAKLEAINTIACRDLRGSTLSALPCLQDPEVQASAASIIAAMTVLTGILNCCTATFWGTLSDHRGRVFVQRIYAFGPLISETLFVTVILMPALPGGRWIIIALGMIDGLFGLGTMTTTQAYIADTASTEDTSRWYSLLMGAYYCGSGVGPLLSSLISRYFGLVPVFFTAIGVHALFFCVVFFLIPESLVPAQLEVAQRKTALELESTSGDVAAGFKKVVWSILEPLAVFLPSSKSFGVPSVHLPTKSFNLTFIVMAYLLDNIITGGGLYYLQYGMALFQWGATQIGYVISANQVSKASYLMFILPLIIKYTRPIGAISPASSRESSRARDTGEDTPLILPSLHKQRNRGLYWDLGLARMSLLLQSSSLMTMAFTSKSISFGLAVTSVSFGAGFVPTVQSLALEFYRRQGGTEAGRLFGALNVVSSFGMQILGPGVMGLVYANSVETMPKLIFWVGAGIALYSFALMLFVHPPPDYSETPKKATTVS